MVSIHAPTQGATHRLLDGFRHVVVSIHAPTQGATSPTGHITFVLTSFNPRTHAGCDLKNLPECLSYTVSIHAPTQGATYASRESVKL